MTGFYFYRLPPLIVKNIYQYITIKMKDEVKKETSIRKYPLLDGNGDGQKILKELDEYVHRLQRRAIIAELEYADVKKQLEKKSAEHKSAIEKMNQAFKEEKASWSSKERSYESKIKTLTEENKILNIRLNSFSPSFSDWKIHTIQFGAEPEKLEGNFSSADVQILKGYKDKNTKLWTEVKSLRKMIENDYIEAQHLEESIMDYTDEKGYDEAYVIFERLNTLLAGVDAWTAVFKRLKKFFKDKKKDIEKNKSPRNIHLTGDHPTYNETYND